MTQVVLGLDLDLTAFNAKITSAYAALDTLRLKSGSGVTLRTFLDTSDLQKQLEEARAVLSRGNTSIKIATDFYKTGSGYAISKTALKRQIINPIQREIRDSSTYKIKIGTELVFDQSSINKMQAMVEQAIAKARGSVEGAQRDLGKARSLLSDLTQTEGQGGLDAKSLRKLQAAASAAGIKTSSTSATALRKEMRQEFSKASDHAIEGLVQGLLANTSEVVDAASDMGKALIKGLKQSLGIASAAKQTKKLGKWSADGFGLGFVNQAVTWERQMAQAIRQAVNQAWKDGLQRDAAARGALADMGREAGQVLSTSLSKALKNGLASSVEPALKGGLLGAIGGAATGGLVGGAGAVGGAIKQAVSPTMLTFGYGNLAQKLSMLGQGASAMASGGANDAFNTFLHNALDTVVQAAISSGGQGALVGAAGVAGVAGAAGLAKGTAGSLVGQAIQSVKDQILGQGAKAALKQIEQTPASAGLSAAGAKPEVAQTFEAKPEVAQTLQRSMQRFTVQLTEGQYNLLEHALQLDNIAEGTFGEIWADLGGQLSRKMKLSADQLEALVWEVTTNPLLDDIDSYGDGDDLGKNAVRIAQNLKKKFANLGRELEQSLAASAGNSSAAAQTALMINDQVLGSALQQSGQLAQKGATTGGVLAPIENANSMFAALGKGALTVVQALNDFAKELTPGRIQDRILNIAWNMDQAAQEFAAAKKNTQILAGKIRNTWDAFSNNVRPQLLPPQPVPGTGLLRQQNLQLGAVVGRTPFDFQDPAYGVRGGRIGPADLDGGRGYIEQTRRTLEDIAGRPGEWKVVEEANGIWQRIKSDSQLARERLRAIAENLKTVRSRSSRMRIWTDREGIGTFNPFDKPFYRPTRPPQAPPTPPRFDVEGFSPAELSNSAPRTSDINDKSRNARGYSRFANEVALTLVNTYVEALKGAIPQVEAASRKLASAPAQAAQAVEAAQQTVFENYAGLPREAVKKITEKTRQAYIEVAASSLLAFGAEEELSFDPRMRERAQEIVRNKGAYPLVDKIPGVDYTQLDNDRLTRTPSKMLSMVQKILQDFYGVDSRLQPKASSSATTATSSTAPSISKAEQEAMQLAQEVANLVNGLASINNFVQSSANQVRRVSTVNNQSAANTQSSQPPIPSNQATTFVKTGPNSFGPAGNDGGRFSGGGNRFGTPAPPPEPPGALSFPRTPVEFFRSFRDADRLLALVARRLAAVGKAFDLLKVKSQIQVDQHIRELEVSLRAVELAFEKGEVSAKDFIGAIYGMQRALAGIEGQSAQVQNVAQAFQNLGGISPAERQAIERQRNFDVDYIQSIFGQGSLEARRAGNLRDTQQLQYANDLVRGAQGASGFGGFRGREIGNDILNKALQATNLKEYINQFDELSQNILQTQRNTETYRRIQTALTEELENASRAYRVLNNEASDGERITHLARNAWGTILDDFQNLVPQLLVFAVAYNLILQRVMGTPGAVLQAAASFDRLNTSISTYLSATRGIGDSSGVIKELQGVALSLGIGFESAAKSYLRFAAATQGTPLEGQEVEITRSLATAGRNQGLSSEQIDRASVALTQILSKGRVQSEELRGQLAEQLPGALQVAARAFGVTTKELYRMVEAGQIAGDEFVGRFMRQLRAEGASTNQLAGSFSNVSEQLGSSIQSLAATAGQPFLAPLTVALQGLNVVIQALIPVAPVVTGLFVVLGAQALRSALGVKSLSAELLGVVRNLFVARDAAEGYSAGLVRLTGVARVAATVLATVGKAALIGLAFEAVAGAIRYLKGEVGALGDELKKVNKIAEGGEGQGLNSLQKLLGTFNVAQNASDLTTLVDADKIGESSDKLTGKILANQKKIGASIREVNRLDKQLYQERIRRDQAEANKDEQGAKSAIERIKKLERQREQVRFEVSPEDVQIQLGALKAAEQATQKLIDRRKALVMGPSVSQLFTDDKTDYSAYKEEQQLERLRKTREEFEKTAKAAGLLDQSLLKVQSLGALQSRLKANQEILPTLDVNSSIYRAQQQLVGGLQQAVSDQQLLPQERALKTQESVLRRMSTELKVQENIQRIKLGLVENERKALEAAVSLERSRGQLREAVAQRRLNVATTLNAPEEQLAAEVQLRRVREANQAKELRMQGQILGKDRERIGIETSLQKEQIKLQTQQLAIDKQMLAIQRLKIEAAAKQDGISADLRRNYYLQLGQIDKTIAATNTLVEQEGDLLQSVEAKGAAELSALGIKQQELAVQLQIIGANSLTAQQVEQIKAAQQNIATKQEAALAAVKATTEVLERQKTQIEDQLSVVQATVEAERQRSQIAEENARKEMGVIDRILELQQGRNEGGFFERMAKASLLGATGEQEAYALASRRMELQRQIQNEQIRQKRLELSLKNEELKAEKAIADLKLQGLRLANEEAKVRIRGEMESVGLTLNALGNNATPAQAALLKQITEALGELGFNADKTGNSTNVKVADLLARFRGVQETDQQIARAQINQDQIYAERSDSTQKLVASNLQLLDVQQKLVEVDAAQWFGQFLDKSSQMGRTLSVLTDGLSEFRSSVSQAFSAAITNGASAADAIADAGQALAGKVLTGLFDEMVLKPMESVFFQGLAKIFNLEKPVSEQAQTATNTGQTKVAVDAVDASIKNLQTAITGGLDAVVQAIGRIPAPSFERPTYPAPSDPGYLSPGQGAMGRSAVVTPQSAAMLDTISYAEGTWDAKGQKPRYDVTYGYQKFDTTKPHPDQMVRSGEYASNAAGAYQFLTSTWKLANKGQNVVMSPQNQDLAALELIRRRNVDPEGGFTKETSAKLAPEWASMPTMSGSSYYGQPVKRFEDLKRFYDQRLKAYQQANVTALDQSLAQAPALPELPSLPPAASQGAGVSTRQAYPLPEGYGLPAGITALPVVPFGKEEPSVADLPGGNLLGSAIPDLNSVVPFLDPAVASSWTQLGTAASSASQALKQITPIQAESPAAAGKDPLLAQTLAQTDEQAKQAKGKADDVKKGMENASKTISGLVTAFTSIALAVNGIEQLGKGGTYNTLMGLASVFGSIAGLASMFIPGIGIFGGARAEGGPVSLGSTYLVGEKGPELFTPKTGGTIIPNHDTESILSFMGGRRNGLSTPGMVDPSEMLGLLLKQSRAMGGPVDARKNYLVGEQGPELFVPNVAERLMAPPASRGDNFAASRGALDSSTMAARERRAEQTMLMALEAPTAPLNIKYESRSINGVEYVTAEEFQKGMRDAAERGRALTMGSLKNNVRSRRQIGI